MDFEAFVKILGEYAPLVLAESWDNVGMIVEPLRSKTTTVTTVMLCIDLTLDVIEEAVNKKAQVVVAYHPVLFSAIKRITPGSGVKQRVVLRAIEAGIAVYCPHTAFDNMNPGINDWICKGIGLGTIIPIKSVTLPNFEGVGAGRILTLVDQYIPVKQLFGLEHVRIATPKEGKVKTVAVCAGSGSSILTGVHADVWITGEMSHHSVLDAVENGTTVVLCDHSNTERGFLRVALAELDKRVNSQGKLITFLQSETDHDPLLVV